jgi:hypothetical protein
MRRYTENRREDRGSGFLCFSHCRAKPPGRTVFQKQNNSAHRIEHDREQQIDGCVAADVPETAVFSPLQAENRSITTSRTEIPNFFIFHASFRLLRQHRTKADVTKEYLI